MTRISVIPELSASGYCRHHLHRSDAVWFETNCYGDAWIELLHALGLNPLAVLPFTLGVDFEGDQWTFFKPSGDDLRLLYGVQVQELTVWRPLLEHTLEQLKAKKFVSTEADAYWLPDTAGTDYRSKHSKTTIIIASIDTEERKLGYFHNAGYFELDGEDFDQLFLRSQENDPSFLPLYAEFIRIDELVQRTDADLAVYSKQLLQRQLQYIPKSNPFIRFGERFAKDLPLLQSKGLPYYHAWAFATIRQAGAAFALTAENLKWLANFDEPNLLAAAEQFEIISQVNKSLILKGARAVNSGKFFDATPTVSDMAEAWNQGVEILRNNCQ